MNILIVDDEKEIADLVELVLKNEGYNVLKFYNSLDAYSNLLNNDEIDLAILDVMMPGLDGFSLARRLRSEGCRTPILFLTARSATEDVVKGFEAGGNDFLKKPFAIDELIVRVKALAGRAEAKEMPETKYKIGEYEFDPSSKALTINGHSTVLAAREAAVLLRLCRKKGQVVEASELLKELWGDNNYFNLRSLNVYITRLRNHFKADSSVEIISVRSVGYRLHPEPFLIV